MILSVEELKNIWFGAYRFEETGDGYLCAYQYSKSQTAYFERVSDFWYPRSMASTAKTLEFTTAADRISLDYRILWKGSMDSIELCVNGRIRDIRYMAELADEGTLRFDLPAGENSVVIYLPADATVALRAFTADAPVKRAVKDKKVLWLGDSITQGYGPLRSGQTYVSVANRILNYEIINQGIGGYVYDKGSLEKMEGYTPDRVIVALGTNQFSTETMQPIEEYYEELTKLYPETPVLCVTPLWRGDCPDRLEVFTAFCEKVKQIAGRYPQVTVVDGFELVPHLKEYFLDNLHPNGLGSEVYGRNLADAILKLGF